MVKLTTDYQQQAADFKVAGIQVPSYVQAQMMATTAQQPIWVHFGGGNLFRCFHGEIAQKLLNTGELTSGVIVAETYDDQVIEQIYHPYQNRFLQVVMAQNGQLQKTLMASVAESIYYNQTNAAGWQRLAEIFANPSLQMVTMSITEKGYGLTDSHGELTAAAKHDISQQPDQAQTNMGAIARLLLIRFNQGQLPIAMVSTDNFSENGQRFQDGILTIARGWVANQLAPQAFVDYLLDSQKVSFPWSMIDRITPNPAEKVAQQLAQDGFEDTTIVHTAKHTNIAPFGNAEETHYLVIEDSFPNGRPALEKSGVIMTDRATVNDADQMKVTACLNPLHTGLAIFGCLLGYQSIAQEMTDAELVALTKQLGYQEDLPVVTDPKIINPRQFIDEVINKRLPNVNIPDTPQRIASDTSQKLAIRYGVTLQHYLDQQADLQQLVAIPLIIAGWLRYLLAVDDNGAEFAPSPDPLLPELQAKLAAIQVGQKNPDLAVIADILANQNLFGVDLVAAGLTDKIKEYFVEMLAGKGAVRQTIQQALEEK
ncbi:mannitol dehydrogenase family protein [Lapidilactobacillus wuchangensis]|uniref:mannitol dehydrogenase family protein n=1 Tax=Lapidilactobacillus wuchangensis TaxID=2486001 RepID=UPI000F7B0CED|nr:mannitol dehydrogenase family protein [Lapidilactobacillus wuchangensis]